MQVHNVFWLLTLHPMYLPLSHHPYQPSILLACPFPRFMTVCVCDLELLISLLLLPESWDYRQAPPCSIYTMLGIKLKQAFYQLNYISRTQYIDSFMFKMLCNSLVLCASSSRVNISNLLFRALHRQYSPISKLLHIALRRLCHELKFRPFHE